MSDAPRSYVCAHGQLARSCQICAIEFELAAAQARIDELEAQVRNQEAQITGHHKYVGQDYQFRLQKLERERDALRAFAIDVLGDWPDDCGVIDGFDVQELALKHGLLTETKQMAPCSENCWCVEYHGSDPGDWADGVICYRKTPLLLDAPREER